MVDSGKMTVKTRNVQVTGVPAEDIETLRPHAQRNGHPPSDASVCRHAIIEYAKQLREDATKEASGPTA